MWNVPDLAKTNRRHRLLFLSHWRAYALESSDLSHERKLGVHVSSLQKITEDDDPKEVLLMAEKMQALLQQALLLAQRKATRRKAIIREILRNGKVEGPSTTNNFKASSIVSSVRKYDCSWIMSMPWTLLVDRTPEEAATDILHTVITNLDMEEKKTWPFGSVDKSE